MSGGVRRIGLIGGECTGKTTLAEGLARTLPGLVVTERLREFVDRHGRAPHHDEQRALMADQQAAEDAAARSCPSGVLIADPAALMTAVYSLAYFDDPSLLPEAAALAHGYDLLVWCDTDLPWEPDGAQRDGPDHREREHAILIDVVRDLLEPSGVHPLLVSGTVAERIDRVARAWQPVGPKPPT